jgi:hypothetical protein
MLYGKREGAAMMDVTVLLETGTLDVDRDHEALLSDFL